MAVTNITRRFGANSNNAAAGAAPQNDRKPAKYWLNVGYPTGDEKYPFVALPMGIPLDEDHMQDLKGSAEHREFLDAGNRLLADLLVQAAAIEPGDYIIVEHPDMPLAMQIRHVGEPQAAPSENRFARGPVNIMPNAK